jgi:hypothetical protein
MVVFPERVPEAIKNFENPASIDPMIDPVDEFTRIGNLLELPVMTLITGRISLWS